jgi:hypothetical protein
VLSSFCCVERPRQGMHDRPSVVELIEAARHHLAEEVAPALNEPRLRFRTLVAANVLAIAGRELSLGEAQAAAEWERLARLLGRKDERPASPRQQASEIAAMNRELCRQIESGHFDETAAWQALLGHCRQTAEEKLAVANPGFLERTHALKGIR